MLVISHRIPLVFTLVVQHIPWKSLGLWLRYPVPNLEKHADFWLVQCLDAAPAVLVHGRIVWNNLRTILYGKKQTNKQTLKQTRFPLSCCFQKPTLVAYMCWLVVWTVFPFFPHIFHIFSHVSQKNGKFWEFLHPNWPADIFQRGSSTTAPGVSPPRWAHRRRRPCLWWPEQAGSWDVRGQFMGCSVGICRECCVSIGVPNGVLNTYCYGIPQHGILHYGKFWMGYWGTKFCLIAMLFTRLFGFRCWNHPICKSVSERETSPAFSCRRLSDGRFVPKNNQQD